MKLTIFFIYIPLVQSGTPEFTAVTTLDGHQIDYYDSDIQKLIPKQDWMEEFESKDMWKEDTEIRKHVQQIYKNIIPVLMERFNQSQGVHTYQRMYGCDWDDETEETQGFDEYGYDGEDFISLDLKKLRYIASVPQGLITTQKWNNDRMRLESLKQYYYYECVYWLRKFWRLRKAYAERTGGLSLRNLLYSTTPQVSLLQKNLSSPVVCHATGFYSSGVSITWLRNGVNHYEDVDHGDLLPNEDGTFQKTSTFRVPPDEWENNEFTCVVEHQGKTIQKILTDDEIKSNGIPIFTILACVMGGLTVLVIGVAVWILLKKRMSTFQTVPSDGDGSQFVDKKL